MTCADHQGGTTCLSPPPACDQVSSRSRLQLSNSARLGQNSGRPPVAGASTQRRHASPALQERHLARASALYPCLQTHPEYYQRNKDFHSPLYLDILLYSPLVPVPLY